MSIGNLILSVNSVTVSCLIHYDSLLPNETAILLQNATVLLQNTTVISNCNNFITKCDSYYKMRRLVQIVTVKLEISRIQEWVFHSLLK